jgi:peptidoglycan/LPS O-acetylase OafA/YrhL
LSDDPRKVEIVPFWSLNYEEQFYLMVGLMIAGGAAWSRHLLLSVVALLAIALAWNPAFRSTCFGFFIEY